MKSLVKIVSLVAALFALQSCTIQVLPAMAGGGGYGVQGGFRPSCSNGQIVRPGYGVQGGSPLMNAYNNGQPAMHRSGYPLAFQPGSRLPSHIDADPSSRYYAGNYVRDSGYYRPEVNAINYTGGDGSTVPVWRGQQSGQRQQRR
jgi:hypothetical protein